MERSRRYYGLVAQTRRAGTERSVKALNSSLFRPIQLVAVSLLKYWDTNDHSDPLPPEIWSEGLPPLAPRRFQSSASISTTPTVVRWSVIPRPIRVSDLTHVVSYLWLA